MTELINEFNLKGSKSTKSSITAHCTVRNVESKNTELCEGALPSCSKSSINMWNLFFLLGQCLIQSCHTVQWGKQPDQQATVTAVSSLISHTLFPVTLSSSSLSADTVKYSFLSISRRSFNWKSTDLLWEDSYCRLYRPTWDILQLFISQGGMGKQKAWSHKETCCNS